MRLSSKPWSRDFTQDQQHNILPESPPKPWKSFSRRWMSTSRLITISGKEGRKLTDILRWPGASEEGSTQASLHDAGRWHKEKVLFKLLSANDNIILGIIVNSVCIYEGINVTSYEAARLPINRWTVPPYRSCGIGIAFMPLPLNKPKVSM